MEPCEGKGEGEWEELGEGKGRVMGSYDKKNEIGSEKVQHRSVFLRDGVKPPSERMSHFSHVIFTSETGRMGGWSWGGG